jgi:hypothetical protein
MNALTLQLPKSAKLSHDQFYELYLAKPLLQGIAKPTLLISKSLLV